MLVRSSVLFALFVCVVVVLVSVPVSGRTSSTRNNLSPLATAPAGGRRRMGLTRRVSEISYTKPVGTDQGGDSAAKVLKEDDAKGDPGETDDPGKDQDKQDEADEKKEDDENTSDEGLFALKQVEDDTPVSETAEEEQGEQFKNGSGDYDDDDAANVPKDDCGDKKTKKKCGKVNVQHDVDVNVGGMVSPNQKYIIL